ncbi:hypothetical protein [Amycolatopsis vancoresmycina]|uniref:Protein kinase domain-containing protein n=1 Tax=Amycolatopsis vancoresmycina DSM 44592 TaxID=1292037 RepID=R1I3N3_9PSEU|nr:hypothetical protein [Amycolatopsis vancoresmycina]EOD67116.1 hypothetical protein H480_18062 [Amycolatopsis vancoresmycina DSM 44592]
MTGTTEADALSGCDLDGRFARWKLIDREDLALPGSRLRTCRVQTTDGATLILRTTHADGDEGTRLLLDNEIRALARLTRAFPDWRPRPFPALVGYAMDVPRPWALFGDYAGVPVRTAADRLLGAQLRDFMVNLFDALAHLSLVEVVHGRLGPDSVRVDGDRVQLVLFEDAAFTGEPAPLTGDRVQLVLFEDAAFTGERGRLGAAPAASRTDLVAAGHLLYEAFTGHPVRGGRPDLAEVPLLAARLGDLFTGTGPGPDAAEVLRRLGREDVPRLEGRDELDAGRAAFDLARRRKSPPKPPAPLPPPPSSRRRSSRTVALVAAAAALLVVAVLVVLIGVSA